MYNWMEEKTYGKTRKAFFAIVVCARKPSGIPLRRHPCSLMSILFNFYSNRQKKPDLMVYLRIRFLLKAISCPIYHWLEVSEVDISQPRSASDIFTDD